MAQKTSRPLVVLSSTAIAAIYLAGYLATRGADVTLAAGAVSTPVPTVSVASASATSTGTYRDGTYTGTGNSRRGGFDVAVTIAGGRIANVAITRAFTEYPASRVASL